MAKPLYKHTVGGVVADWMVPSDRWINGHLKDGKMTVWKCPEVMEDLTRSIWMFNKDKWERPEKQRACKWHMHEDGKQCEDA